VVLAFVTVLDIDGGLGVVLLFGGWVALTAAALRRLLDV
jgi:hypothetical protein